MWVFNIATSWRRVLVLGLVALLCALAPGNAALAQHDLKSTPEASGNEFGAGLADEGRWRGPLFGVEAEWDASWQPTVNQTWSNQQDGEEQLLLGWSENLDGDLYLIVRETGRGGPPIDVAHWQSDEFLSDIYTVDHLEVLLSDEGTATRNGAVLLGISHASMPYPVFHYKQSISNDEGMGLYLLIEAPGYLFVDTMEAALQGFQLNGEPVELPFSVEEAEAAIAGYDAVPYDETAAGLVADGHYAGPVCDVEIEWSDSWEISRDVEYPVVSDPLGPVDVFYMNHVDVGPTGPFLDVQASGSIQGDPGRRIDDRTQPTDMQYLWGPDAESEVLLRDIGDDHAEAVVAIEVPDMVETVYLWSSYTWIDATQCNAYIELTASASEFEAAWTTLNEDFSITLGNEPFATTLTWDDLEEAIAGS